MRPLLLSVVLACGCRAADDAREIIRRSVNLGSQNLIAARDYTFQERFDSRTLDAGGRVTKTEIETYDVTMVDGSPYRRLISRDDKPLPARDEQKEQEKLRRIAEQRRKETPAEREKRRGSRDRRQEEWQATVRQVATAFDFQMAGEDHREGRDQYVIAAAPHPGYKPHTRYTSFFPKVKGRIWIDKQDYHWVRVEAETIDTISFGAFLVRLAPGSHMELEQVRVNNEVWLPKRFSAVASARVALFKKYRGRLDITYSDYKKFQTDSRIIPVEAP